MVAILFLLVTTMVLAFAAGLDSRIPPGDHWWSSRKNKVILYYTALVGILLALATYHRIHMAILESQRYRAVNEIHGMELALYMMLSDAGRNNLRDLFEPRAFNAARHWYADEYNADTFEASVAVYTQATNALLFRGRHVLESDQLPILVQRVFRPEVVRNLRPQYKPDHGDDPWGHPYQFLPGPWPDDLGPVLFRRSWGQPADDASPADRLTLLPAGDPALPLGIPAPSRTTVYIWSLGANGVSDQPRYDPTHQYAPPARQHYRSDAPDEYLGGGDDINNWDKDQTFVQFYN